MSDPKIELAFHPSCTFSTAYQRNNKSNGNKNLRCFPSHCFEGHRSGWCGHPLMVRTSGTSSGTRLIGLFSPKFSSDIDASDQATEQQQLFYNNFTLGAVIKREELESRLKSDLAECIEGVTDESPKECTTMRTQWEEVNQQPAPPLNCDKEFVFNSRSKGWHYGFIGSKKDSDLLHVWSVFALEPNEDGSMYTFVTRLDSPPFTLFCRRRNKGLKALGKKEESHSISGLTCVCTHLSTPITAPTPTTLGSLPVPSKKGFNTPSKKRDSLTSKSSSSASSTRSSKRLSLGSSFTSELEDQGQEHVSSELVDNRFKMLFDVVRLVQLSSKNLSLVDGLSSESYGESVLALSKHWKQLDHLPLPLSQYLQDTSKQSQQDNTAYTFTSFLLTQPDFIEEIKDMHTWPNQTNYKLDACQRMQWLLAKQVVAVQRMRSEKKMTIPTTTCASPAAAAPLISPSSAFSNVCPKSNTTLPIVSSPFTSNYDGNFSTISSPFLFQDARKKISSSSSEQHSLSLQDTEDWFHLS